MSSILLDTSVSVLGMAAPFRLADHLLPQLQPILARLTANVLQRNRLELYASSYNIINVIPSSPRSCRIRATSASLSGRCSPRARAKKYRLFQPYIGRNPGKKIAHGALGIGIQKFHGWHFGRNTECRQFGHRSRIAPRFKLVLVEIARLHEGNIARFRLRPNEFRQWQSR
jgi:hypothetical protein